jgi:type II secretion system protein H
MRVKPTTGRQAFTMIELILVMALLVAMISVAAPMLSDFFRGRTLDSEARRLLALTRAAQVRAVSEGLPMLLWVDPNQHTYGLEQEMPPRDGDPRALEFALDDSLILEATKTAPVSVRGKSLTAIRFLPEGVVDETSPPVLRLTSIDGFTLSLVQTTNRVNYEIRNNHQ